VVICSVDATRSPIVVIRFGSRALETPTRLGLAALRVKEQVNLGFAPVVVVSANSKTSDRLLEEIRRACGERGEVGASALREIDRALGNGEAISAALLAAAIAGTGGRAESVPAGQAVLLASGQCGSATLSQLLPGRIASLLTRGVVPVVAGFQGVLESGELVTLGAGSSDMTAVLLASELNAVACHIVTDVSGIHEEDPRIAHDSPRYSALTFEELVKITEQGARVFDSRAARAAHSHSIPLHIYHYRAELSQPKGTLVGNAW
jgi:aspartate kinase